MVNRDEQYKKPHAHLYVLIILDMQVAVLAIMAENSGFLDHGRCATATPCCGRVF